MLAEGTQIFTSFRDHQTVSDVRFCRTYRLDVEQHPERTAEYGPAVLSRLPLAPPPIVRLTITDQAGSPINPCVLS